MAVSTTSAPTQSNGLRKKATSDHATSPAAPTSARQTFGGVSRGSVESVPDALVFPATQYVADGQSMTYRVRWTKLSDTSYEAWSEMQVKDGWTTMFKLTMKQSS